VIEWNEGGRGRGGRWGVERLFERGDGIMKILIKRTG